MTQDATLAERGAWKLPLFELLAPVMQSSKSMSAECHQCISAALGVPFRLMAICDSCHPEYELFLDTAAGMMPSEANVGIHSLLKSTWGFMSFTSLGRGGPKDVSKDVANFRLNLL